MSENRLDLPTKLENARRHLLDLTTRNRLLSIPQSPRAQLIRIEDELSEEVFRLLVLDGKKLRFLPGDEEEMADETLGSDYVALPQPDEDEEADARGVASRHTDIRLQTALNGEALQKRLLSLYYGARTAIEEQGVNTLYLALGQLRWREDRASGIDRFAPLLLVPVGLERSTAQTKFRLKALEQEPSDNLSLAEKVKEFGVMAPPFEFGEDFSLSAYFYAYKEAVEGQKGWEVLPDAMVLGFFSFAKFLMFRDLDPDNWPEDSPIDEHALIASLLGDGFARQEALIPEDRSLDEVIPVERLSHVIDADSSQSLAVEEVRSGRHLVIQGPPGTGKSQTITNLIATAVLDGKKVLFVAEKLAALEVVKRRLDEIGLDVTALELHSHKSNKREVLQEIGSTLRLGAPTDEASREQTLRRLDDRRQRLNAHAERLNAKREPCGLSMIEIMGRITQAGSSMEGREIPKLVSAVTWSEEEYRERRGLLRELERRVAEIGNPPEHLWVGVGRGMLTKFEVDEVVEMARALRCECDDLTKASRRLTEALSVAGPETLDELQGVIELGQLMGVAPEYDREAIAEASWMEALGQLGELVRAGEGLAEPQARTEERFSEGVWTTELSQMRKDIAAHGGSLFRVFMKAHRDAMAAFRGILRDPVLPKRQKDQLEWLDDAIQAKKLKRIIDNEADEGRRHFGRLWQEKETPWDKLEALVEWVDLLKTKGCGPDFLQMASRVQDAPACRGLAAETSLILGKVMCQFNALRDRLSLDIGKAFGTAEVTRVSLRDLESKLDRWIADREALSKWVSYRYAAQVAGEKDLEELVEAFDEGRLASGEAEPVFDFGYLKRIYENLVADEPELLQFNGSSHHQLVEEFRQLDQARIGLARREVLRAHHERMPQHQNAAGALGILMSEMKRKRGHMPIRKLIETSGPAIQAIKPVFMMSPLSVAQFLAPGAVEFDLVIFDEASQVEPVEALGAIARGSQLVVVGDERQLPPTRFFSRFGMADGEDDEDDDGVAQVGDIESVLGLAEAKGLPNKMLRWHYRSRHESLITVSNHEFYDNQLFIIPSPRASENHLGLQFHKVEGGTFDRGRTKCNRREAKAVAEAVIRHATVSPQRSLGVAAFSVSQRDAILDELEWLRRKHPETEAFFHQHPFEPFFVKNLENVQGDERDVIFISVGYAPDEHGVFMMNFGPLNRDGGERRLNVLISRAKETCRVFSSIEADQIDLNRARARGVVALKSFLRFAATGILDVPDDDTGRCPDSPFEECVKRELEKEGYEVRAQIGTAGFFIDLAVVDSENPGRFLLGIECDGASYHSARSARERDRQRQAVLEAHDWTIHRIWSSDWFERPKDQLRRTVEAIEEAKLHRHKASPPAHSDTPETAVIEREVIDEAAEVGVPHAIPYTEADFEVPRQYDLQEFPLKDLAEIVAEILKVEAPIHEDELVSRVRQLWGLARSGSRIRERVMSAVDQLEARQSVSRSGNFLHLGDQELQIRDRSEVQSTSLRKPENLPPAEVEHAICKLVKLNHGLNRGEIPRVVGEAFGFRSTGQRLRSVIEEALEGLLERGALSENNERIKTTR